MPVPDRSAEDRHRTLFTLASITALFALWHLAAAFAGSRLLPTPMSVIEVLVEEIEHGEMLFHLGVTLARVAAAFLIAMVIGTAIGILMGRLARFNLFFDSWLILLLNIPALVTIILAYVWFGLIEAAAIGAVAINKIPTVVVVVREGARALDPGYLEMATIYRFGRARTLRHVVLPQLYPFLVAAARSGLALIWKIVLVVELLGRSSGVGFQLQVYFQLFDVTRILAYTLAFVAIMQIIEFGMMQPLERRVSRWRP